MMFGVAMELVDEELRQRGKVAELALGYQGGEGAIATMDIKKKIKPADRQPLVDRYRAANPAIVAYWKKVNNAALHTISTGEKSVLGKGISMVMERGIFFIILPSGRRLAYLKPRIGINRFGGDSIIYKGQNQKTNKWEDLETYGGKLVENIDQAIARDLLAHGMMNVDEAGYDIVSHVHDELINEVPLELDCLQHLAKLMTTLPDWAAGLPLKVKGFETLYYKKD
jgi:DNA polymerase